MEGIDLAGVVELLIQIFKGFKSTLPRPAPQDLPIFAGRGGARLAFFAGRGAHPWPKCLPIIKRWPVLAGIACALGYRI